MKLPFSFSLKFIYRILLPGLILALGFVPLINYLTNFLEISIKLEYTLLLSSIIFGWFLQIIDMHIYMMYEGRRYWPKWLRIEFTRSELKRLRRLENRYDKTRERLKKSKSNTLRYITYHNEYVELSDKIRQFPVDEEGNRVVKFPTKIGNLIYSYESYPNIVYGINSIFYWYWLWMVIDKDLKNQIDDQQGMADSTIYVAFTMNLVGIMCLFYATLEFFRLQGIISLSLFEFSILPRTLLLFSGLSFLVAYSIYTLSLQIHITYGNMFKALFDAHRDKIDLNSVTGEIAGLVGDESLVNMPDAKKYKIVWRYLRNYKIEIQGKKTSIFQLGNKNSSL